MPRAGEAWWCSGTGGPGAGTGPLGTLPVVTGSGSRRHPFRDVRLHIVTGKGGTGKTTIAGALALSLAAEGHRVLLVEAEGRQGIAQLFDVPPLPYEERKIASASGGGEVYALAIDPEEALLDYLEMFYNLKRAGRVLKRFGVVDFATTVAPGMRDVLITGKIKEAVVRTGQRGRTGLRRRRPRRPTDRAHRPLPQRHQRGRRAGQGRAGQGSGRQRRAAPALAEDGGPPRDDPRGDARPGDDRRCRGADRGPDPRRCPAGQHDPRAVARAGRTRARAGEVARPRGRDRRAEGGGHRRRPTTWRACSRPRPPTTPTASPSRPGSGPTSTSSSVRSTNCRCCPRRSNSGRSTGSPTCCGRKG